MRLLMLFHGTALIHLSGRVDPKEEAHFYQQVQATPNEQKQLSEVGSGPLLIMRWILEEIVKHNKGKHFVVEAPILSRTMQVISDCREAWNECRMISETPFPFPYAQLCFFALHWLLVLVPWTVSAFVEGYWAPALIR
jgi:hypothetical protein